MFKNKKSIGGEKLKDWLTVMLTLNTTGSNKKKPVVIGKSNTAKMFQESEVFTDMQQECLDDIGSI